MKSFRIGALNCHGLKGKYELPDFINEILSCEIFGVSETWTDKDEKDRISVPGYKFYPLSRKKEKGPTRGGLGVFIRETERKGIKILYDINLLVRAIIWPY